MLSLHDNPLPRCENPSRREWLRVGGLSVLGPAPPAVLKAGPGSARQIKPNDWPYFGSIVKMLKPSQRLPALTSVWVPDIMRLNDNVMPAGQTAGFIGKQWEPERFVGDPAAPDYRIAGVALP